LTVRARHLRAIRNQPVVVPLVYGRELMVHT
jgi:hypothetical protein